MAAATHWHLFSGTDEEWDLSLLSLEGYNPYLTSAWVRLKGRLGNPMFRMRCVEDTSGKVVSVMVGLLRRLPFQTGYVNIHGGFCGDLSCWNEHLFEKLKKVHHLKRIYLRAFGLKPRVPLEVAQLQGHGWQPVLVNIHTGLTMGLDLGPNSLPLTESASSNWRHNLRRGLKRNLKVESGGKLDPAAVRQIYGEMEQYKNIHEQFSAEELKGWIEEFGEQLRVVSAKDETGKLLGLRAAVVVGSKGFDTFAVATREAREVYASHVLLHELLNEVKARGVTSYDLSGIDPKNGQGVYNFKKGSGAEHIEYLGEWEWASSKTLRFGMSLLMLLQLWRRTRRD